MADNGVYTEKEAENFANYVNNTMLFNYSNEKTVGPYKVKTPQITKQEAWLYLNRQEKEYRIKIESLEK